MRIRWLLCIPLTLFFAVSAVAAQPVDVQEYVKIRKAWLTSLPFDSLESQPSAYVGKVFELRGNITGLSKNESGGSIILNTADRGSFVISVDALPCENPGITVACLVKIGQGSVCSLSDLRLLACTYSADLVRYEEGIKPKPAPVVTRQVQPNPNDPTPAKDNKKQPIQVSSSDILRVYKQAVKDFNSKLSDSQAETIARSILGFSSKYSVDPRLVCAVILAESNFRITATSSAGAQGLGQLMPSTAAGLGVSNAYDPVENVYGSVRYIRSMLDRMSGNKKWNELSWNDLALALAAYNAGPGAVKKYGGIPPYRETQAYVKKVTSIYKQLCGIK